MPGWIITDPATGTPRLSSAAFKAGGPEISVHVARLTTERAGYRSIRTLVSRSSSQACQGRSAIWLFMIQSQTIAAMP